MRIKLNAFRKRAIRWQDRAILALRYGCRPGTDKMVHCAKCDAHGRVCWSRLRADGRPSSWITFPGMEIDHVIPEFRGGAHDASNFQLLCRRCNRSKGHR